MFKHNFLGVFLLLNLINLCFTAKILYISTTASPSHHIWEKTLAMALRDKKHSITFVTHSEEKPLENFQPIILEGFYEKLHDDENYLMDLIYFGPVDAIKFLYDWMETTCVWDLKTEGLKTLVNQAKNGVKYDIILFDMTTGHCLYPIIELFGSPPVIGTSPFGLIQYFTYAFGIDLNIAYNPLNFLPYTNQMTYFERVSNLLHTMFFNYRRQYVYMPAQQKLAEEYFGKNISSIIDIEKKFQLLLTNTDPIFDYPQPVPPCIVEVGGLHTRRAKPLPRDLQEYLDTSKNGVIYFAFGTNVQSDKIGEENINAFLQAFAQLKENIIWKFESELKNLPKNVLIRKWLPQNDILAHPNVKMFISHGGGLSTQEAMFHGVPVLGVPFFADQHVNMRKMANRNLGLKLDLTNITKDTILESIREILHNPKHRTKRFTTFPCSQSSKKNAVLISQRYRGRSEDALTRAVNAVEYVLKFGGDHLQIAAKDMSIIQVELLDIWIPLAIIVFIVFKLIIYLFKCFTKSSNCKSSKKKIN